MMWLAVGAGMFAIWLGLGLYCAETFMGGHRDSRVWKDSVWKDSAAGVDRESRTPIPRPRVAD